MLARCAHCQKTFSTDRFGVQRCPHCGWEVLLADPNGPQEPAAAPQPPPLPGPAWGAPPPPPPADWPPAQGAQPPAGPWAQPGQPPPAGPWTPPAAPPQGGWGAGPSATPWGPMAPGTVLPPATPADPGLSSPFARRRDLGWLGAFGQTWRLVAFEPPRFFRFVSVRETSSALLFGIISFTLGTWISLVYAALAGGASSTALQQLLRRLPPGILDPDAAISALQRGAGATAKGLIGQAIITPIAGLVGIYVGAAIFHVLLLAVRGAPRGFSATLTVVAYAYGMFLLEALPMCGGVVAFGWLVVTLVVGLAETQRCGPGRAGFAVLAPALLFCACLCASMGLLAAQLGGAGISNLPEGGTGL